MKKIDIKMLVVLALMISLNIVLSRIVPAVNLWNTKISLAFITLVITGNLYGPYYSGLVAGISDFIGALLFPTAPFNPLFTLTAIISGVIFGIFKDKNMDIKYVLIECILNGVLVTMLLNSLIISYVYKASFVALLSTRAIQALIMLVIEVILISLLNPAVKSIKSSINR